MGAESLDNIAIVLVEPQGPLNVGATARAMKNMGLRSLIVVGDIDLTSDECRLFASGSTDVLESARIVDDLDEALADRSFIVGTTARGRHRVALRSPREAATELVSADGPAAILFGREDFGLSKEQLARCHRVITIPTSVERASLNLSQAVMVIAYEVFMAADAARAPLQTDLGAVLTGDQWERLYREMLVCCAETGYLSDGNRVAIEASLRRLLTLGPIQTRDARHLFGLVRRVAKLIDGRADARPAQGFYERMPGPREGDR